MRADVNGTEIEYIDKGEGENIIVFVHGLGGNIESWRYQIDHFSKRNRVIVLDLRGQRSFKCLSKDKLGIKDV